MTESLQNLTLRQKIGQLFFIGISGTELDESTITLLSEISPGGVCMFARNIREAAQTRVLLDGIQNLLSDMPFLSLDQEGGTVDRLRRIVTPMAAANKIRTAGEAAKMASLIAETIRILGFNMNFAPVVDVVSGERIGESNGLYSRPFSGTKEDVVDFAGAFLREMQGHDVLGCLKHFPGLGAARVDSHEDLPHVQISPGELFSTDLFPYEQLFPSGEIRVLMAAHACFPQLDLQEADQNGKLLPSSLSYNFITKLLRNQLKFDGLVVTDDMEMGAIVKNYGIGEACKMAIIAGVDMLSICADPANIREGFNAVLKAVVDGNITENRIDHSIVRIAELKAAISPRVAFNENRIAELSDEIADFNACLEKN